MKACYKGHDKVVERLLAAGAQTDVWAMVSSQIVYLCFCWIFLLYSKSKLHRVDFVLYTVPVSKVT